MKTCGEVHRMRMEEENLAKFLRASGHIERHLLF